jgi:hypothetical protein
VPRRHPALVTDSVGFRSSRQDHTVTFDALFSARSTQILSILVVRSHSFTRTSQSHGSLC